MSLRDCATEVQKMAGVIWTEDRRGAKDLSDLVAVDSSLVQISLAWTGKVKHRVLHPAIVLPEDRRDRRRSDLGSAFAVNSPTPIIPAVGI